MSKQKPNIYPKSAFLLKVKLSSTSLDEVLKIIEVSLRLKKKFFISTPNPEIVLQAQEDEELLKSLNKSDIAIPDGTGLLWGAKKLSFPFKLYRIPGRKLMTELFRLANRKKYKVFLLGASEKVNKKALRKLGKEFPKLRAEGSSDIAINTSGMGADRENIKKINDFNPHILLVALGAPKQEKWVVRNMSKIDAGAIMVIGGSLDHYTGSTLPVPDVVSKIGFEWFWRLLTQPARLPRIFNAVIRFPLLVLKSK